MFLVVDNERKQQLAWVTAILEARRWKPNRLSTMANIDPSALSRFLNDPTGKRTLNSYTVEKIERASGVPAYSTEVSTQIPFRGMAEGDGIPYDAGGDTDTDLAIRAIKRGRNGVDPWILSSRCLENLGYLPGDVLIIDLNSRPQRGDIVVAQIYDKVGGAQTVIRRLGEPFLYAATSDPELMEPVLIDKNVVVRGKLLTSIRPVRAA